MTMLHKTIKGKL